MKKMILLFTTFLLTACSNTTSENIDHQNYTAVISLNETITLNGRGVEINNNHISITEGGSYIFKGQLNEGSIEVNTKDKVKLIFDDVSITNPFGPCLLITDAKEVTLEIRNQNILEDGFSGNENDAAIYSNDTLIIEGNGSLEITGNNNEGISSDDDIIIKSGNIYINSVDDGLNAKDDITINGGYIFIKAQGDGIDSNGSIHINGGTIISLGNTKGGNGGIDTTKSYTITGGTVIATGTKITLPSISSTQESIYIPFEKKLNANTIIHIESEKKELITFSPQIDTNVFYFSSKDLELNTTYSVYIGGTYDGENKDGLYSGGKYQKSTNTFKINAFKQPSGMEVPEDY